MKYSIFLLFTILLSSCFFNGEDDVLTELGSVEFSVSVGEESLLNGRENTVVTDDFDVILLTASQDTVQSWSRVADVPGSIELPVGSYIFKVFSDQTAPPIFDLPYYYGESSAFQVVEDNNTQVNVSVTLQNVRVSIIFSDSVKSDFSDYQVRVSDPVDGFLTFDKNEVRSGFFNAGELIFLARLDYTNQLGESKFIEKSFTVTASNNDHLQVNINADLNDGSAGINVTVDGENNRIVKIDLTSTSDLTSGLVAYYPFSGDANDQSGNSLNGRVEGASLTTDRNGNSNSAYNFSGNVDVIVVPHSPLLNITNNLTLAVWVKLESTNQWGSRIIDKAISGTGTGYLLDIYNPANTASTFQETPRFIGGSILVSDTEITLNQWTHLAATFQDGVAKIYVNGTQVSTQVLDSTTLTTHSEDLQIGNDIYGTGPNLFDPFRGDIDEVRIYNRVLDESELQSLMSL